MRILLLRNRIRWTRNPPRNKAIQPRECIDIRQRRLQSSAQDAQQHHCLCMARLDPTRSSQQLSQRQTYLSPRIKRAWRSLLHQDIVMLLQKLGELSPELRCSRFLRLIVFRTPHFPHEHGHNIRPRRMIHIQPRCFEGSWAHQSQRKAEIPLYGVGLGNLLPLAFVVPYSKHGEQLKRSGGFLGFPVLCRSQIKVMSNWKADINEGKYFNEDILIVCTSGLEDQAGCFC